MVRSWTVSARSIETRRVSERNKRSIAINQSYIKLSKNKKLKTDRDRVCILYKYCGGYLLFELNDDYEPVQIWRDFNRGKFPLQTQYAPLIQFPKKILNFRPTIIYTNDAEPLQNLTLVYTLVPFFVPIHDLLNTLSAYNNNTVINDSTQTPYAVSDLPTYESVKELDPYITYKEYKQIYRTF